MKKKPNLIGTFIFATAFTVASTAWAFSSIWYVKEDCVAILTSDKYSCRSDDCKAILTSDKYACKSSNCKALIMHDKYACGRN